MFNQLMVLPNVIALIALSGVVAKCANKPHAKGKLKPEDKTADLPASE